MLEVNRGGRGKKADSVQFGIRISRQLDSSLRAEASRRGVTPGALASLILTMMLAKLKNEEQGLETPAI